ncbi:hypothetical protein AXE80_10860 [Wenyingzhuangia fucanilytica]|uniref:Uncharacterized protein n=1 Tax=Wenyingzhuangia fucanilytica TaxID=1790137 RepID=A0A1B1Y7N3_9FLAO|nr:hypothetical protein [Wenyingzhuangia fucanilytica]ANW96744.1 hypothetical protein AXE80_10860 [Wenyingzhuangia fucanilytica]
MENQVIDLTPSHSLITQGNNAGLFEVMSRENKQETTNDSSIKDYMSWSENTIDVDGFCVIPYGKDNALDKEIQEVVFGNNIAPRSLTKKVSLLFGQGAELYKTTRLKGKVIREYVEHTEIQKWLDQNDYKDIMLCSAVDFYYTEGCFFKVRISKNNRSNKGASITKIPTIEYLDLTKCRLAYKRGASDKKPTHVLVGDWNSSYTNKYVVYPLFDAKEPTKHKTSIYYSKFKSFGIDDYAIPDLLGTLPWIKRASAIPFILEALTNNSLNLKFHIKSPQKYWDSIEDQLKKKAELENKPYNPKDLKDFKNKVFKEITDVLSGVDNVGKFWHSVKSIDANGVKVLTHDWEIVPIEQKTKDFVTAQLDISKHAAFSTTAGLGLHNALAGVGADGKSDSGSEQIYAYKNHILTETPLPEMVITKIWNIAIKHNWPEANLKVGFYHHMPEKEEDLTASNRHNAQGS